MPIKQIISDLMSEIGALKKKFLETHLLSSTIETPDQYRLDVKAFAVLAHAAMEQAFEDVCESVADAAHLQYKESGRITSVTLSLLTFMGPPLPQRSDEKSISLDPRTDHLHAIGASIKEFKQSVIRRNQGMSCKYLGRLLEPIAISTVPDVDELDALNQLKVVRGDSAHRYQARYVVDPVVITQHVDFCHGYFSRVATEAAGLIGESI